MNNRLLTTLLLMGACITVLTGCVNKPVKPDNPYYAPVVQPALQQPRVVNGAIYNAATSNSLYSDGRAHRVGDILTIVLSEKTQSSKSANTKTSKSGSMSLPQANLLGTPLSLLTKPLTANIPKSTSSTSGTGSSDMSNSLKGNISVTVHEVLPNGVLAVRGEKWVNLNQGDEFIQISGLVRPQDIKADNTIASTKLADARIGYSGTGAVHDTNVVGWLSRFFIGPLWPF